jgi:hypothetical protein
MPLLGLRRRRFWPSGSVHTFGVVITTVAIARTLVIVLVIILVVVVVFGLGNLLSMCDKASLQMVSIRSSP